METVKQLNKQEFTTKVADIEKSKGEWKFLGERPAVIDFYKVDIDREQELAAVFGVRSVPTLLFIPLSGMPQMMTGGRPKSDLKRIIDEVLMGK